MTRDPRKPGDPLLPTLDGEPGPLPPLSAAESDALAWAAVSRWAARPPGLDPIDDAFGPAQPLESAAAEQLARQVVRASGRRRVSRQLQPWAARAAAVALGLCGALGVAFAAYRLWPPGATEPLAQPSKTFLRAAADGGEVAPAVSVEPAKPLEQLRDSEQAGVAIDQRKLETSLPIGQAAADAGMAPEALLAHANALRAQRRWAAAERVYRQIARAGASKEQRYVALVAGAALALQHLHKPARALREYQAALELIPAGNLDEEALFGIAECQRALADSSAELAALQRLSVAHPSGMFTAASKQRRVALEAAASVEVRAE